MGLLGGPFLPTLESSLLKQTRALNGLLDEKCGRHICPCKGELSTYLVARGRPIGEIPFTVDKDDEKAWEDEWIATLESATSDSCDKLDRKQLIGWLRARGTSSSLLANTGGMARVAMEAMIDCGISVDAAAAAELERRLTLSESGDEQKQCENPLVAYLILTNHPPSIDQTEEWERRVAAQKGKEIRTVNIVGEESYKKRMKVTTSTVQRPNLEQALDRGRRVFREWFTEMSADLSSHSMSKASTRLAEVCNDAESNSDGLWAAEEAYLRHYFFREHLGMGLPSRNAPGAFRKAIAVLNRPVTAADAKLQQMQQQLEQASLVKLRHREASESGSNLGKLLDLASLSGTASDSSSDVSSALGSSASQVGLKALVQEALREAGVGGSAAPAGGSIAGGAEGYTVTVAPSVNCQFCGRPAGRQVGAQCQYPLDPTKLCCRMMRRFWICRGRADSFAIGGGVQAASLSTRALS